MDYEVQRCSRHCAATGRELAPGEAYYSALIVQGAEVVRVDYALDAWPGPPPDAIGWWKSHRPDPGTRPTHWAPNDVMLDFFDRLESEPENQDMRYVLALLLVRRRVLRLEETQRDEHGRELLVLYCPRRETTHRIAAIVPDAARIEQIQDELARLLR